MGGSMKSFSRRQTGAASPDGHYETTYRDAGKFLIEGDAVSQQPFKEGQSYSSARAEIRREMSKAAKEQD